MFEDEQGGNTVGNISIVPGAPKGMLAWLIKAKIVDSGRQAEYFLLGVAIAAIVLAVGLFVVSNHHLPAQTPLSPSWPKPIAP